MFKWEKIGVHWLIVNGSEGRPCSWNRHRQSQRTRKIHEHGALICIDVLLVLFRAVPRNATRCIFCSVVLYLRSHVEIAGEGRLLSSGFLDSAPAARKSAIAALRIRNCASRLLECASKFEKLVLQASTTRYASRHLIHRREIAALHFRSPNVHYIDGTPPLTE